MNKPTRTQLLLTVSVAAICALASSARSQQIKADGTVVFVPADVVIDTGTTAAAAGSVLWALNSGYINADAGVELTTGGINAHAVLAMLNSTILVSAGTVTMAVLQYSRIAFIRLVPRSYLSAQRLCSRSISSQQKHRNWRAVSVVEW